MGSSHVYRIPALIGLTMIGGLVGVYFWPRSPAPPLQIDTSYLFAEATISSEVAKLAPARHPDPEKVALSKRHTLDYVHTQQLVQSLAMRKWTKGPLSRLTTQERATLQRILLEMAEHNPSLYGWTQIPSQGELMLKRERNGQFTMELRCSGLQPILFGLALDLP